MINKQKVFVKIKEFIIEIISEFFSNKKIIGMVILMIFVAVFKVSIIGFTKEEVTETPKEKVSLDFLNSDEKELLRKFLKSDINDDATKIMFSNFMKTSKGTLTVQKLRKGIKTAFNRGEINDTDLVLQNKIMNKMEKTKTEWSSQKLLDENESNDKKIK
jgi:hypothetical protein